MTQLSRRRIDSSLWPSLALLLYPGESLSSRVIGVGVRFLLDPGCHPTLFLLSSFSSSLLMVLPLLTMTYVSQRSRMTLSVDQNIVPFPPPVRLRYISSCTPTPYIHNFHFWPCYFIQRIHATTNIRYSFLGPVLRSSPRTRFPCRRHRTLNTRVSLSYSTKINNKLKNK